jgi:hypothetical protein
VPERIPILPLLLVLLGVADEFHASAALPALDLGRRVIRASVVDQKDPICALIQVVVQPFVDEVGLILDDCQHC